MREVRADGAPYPPSGNPESLRRAAARNSPHLSRIVKLFGSEGQESSQYQRRKAEGRKREDSPVIP